MIAALRWGLGHYWGLWKRNRRCRYWAWVEVEGDWFVMRCARHRWHVTMHLIDPLNDTGLS